jgi:hypothetical protein
MALSHLYMYSGCSCISEYITPHDIKLYVDLEETYAMKLDMQSKNFDDRYQQYITTVFYFTL